MASSSKKRRVEVFLEPAVVCCSRDFRTQRALDAHRASHRRCPSCQFEGSKAALAEHACGDQELRPPPPPSSTETTDEYRRKDGSAFSVVDEAVPDEVPLEARV